MIRAYYWVVRAMLSLLKRCILATYDTFGCGFAMQALCHGRSMSFRRWPGRASEVHMRCCTRLGDNTGAPA
eukprot:5867861-Prorocentrum_lima.AAC.1